MILIRKSGFFRLAISEAIAQKHDSANEVVSVPVGSHDHCLYASVVRSRGWEFLDKR